MPNVSLSKIVKGNYMSSTDEKPNYNARITVEGGIKVLYKGLWVTEIDFTEDEITLGVIDPEHDIYPDINLRQYRLDGGDPYISRKHAKFLHKENLYFIQDICNNNSTSIGTKTNVINNETIQLNHGDRIFLSESLSFRFELIPQDDTNTKQNEQSEVLENEAEENDNIKENAETEDVPFDYYLEIDKQTPLFFKPSNKFENIIRLNPGEWPKDEENNSVISIGRRSTEDGVYPDIDLWKFYFNDGDEYIARKHAQIVYHDGTFFFEDVSGKGSTWINEKDEENRLLKTKDEPAKIELKVGDKLIISDSVVFTFKKQELS